MSFDGFILSAVPNSVLDIMVWVVFSLFIFDFINRLTNDKLYEKIEKTKYTQPLWAAFLGSIPGCGGAIVLSNLYVKKKVTLGSLTACFIATFGDAAFVILATDPIVFLWLLLISFVVGVIVGYIIDFTPIGTYLNKKVDYFEENSTKETEVKGMVENKKAPKVSDNFIFIDRYLLPSIFMVLFLTILPVTISSLFFPIDTGSAGSTGSGNAIPPEGTIWVTYYQYSYWISLAIIVFFIPYYFIRKFIMKNYDDRNALEEYLDSSNCGKNINSETGKQYSNEKQMRVDYVKLQHKTFLDSIFILTWVFFGLLIFNIIYYPFESAWIFFFGLAGGFVGILVAVGVGVIPGCGPQIAFASVYLNPGVNPDTGVPLNPGEGAISSSAITANSINQDGDAGFPLLAVDKRTFLVIRILNIIPALLVGAMLLPIENHGLLPY